jgi:S-adenosylmethionine:tRNA ribosyltransferase-isomerase
MRVEAFDFTLPRGLIAQFPSSQRGESRLMVIHRQEGAIEHRAFQDLPNYLRSGDLLITNNTRVLPCRLIGKKETGGKVEVLLIPSWNGMEGKWKVLIKGSGKLKAGTRIQFGETLWAEVEPPRAEARDPSTCFVGRNPPKHTPLRSCELRRVTLHASIHGLKDRGFLRRRVKETKEEMGELSFSGAEDVPALLRQMGHIPLPPYIKRQDEPLDRDRYQTIFAERDGSIAAPTAGLHFTHALRESLREQGVTIASITLHIGPGTFRPVKALNVEDHRMEEERVEIPKEIAGEIAKTRVRGGRVIAVGTTATRALESFSDGMGGVSAGQGMTPLFIYPPYLFRVIDGLITNFHLPRSTLIMLASAFAGRDLLMKAYQEAIEKKYRFYSYGDAMLIL